MKMVKQQIENETRSDKFKRIAAMRTQRILDDLRLLGNCANSSSYEYSDVAVSKIFVTIEKELKRVKASFNKPVREFDLT